MLSSSSVTDARLAAMLRQHEVEQFLYNEAAHLDARRFAEWLELFDDNATYFMPLRRTRLLKELDQEFTKPGEMALFDETKAGLAGRVNKLLTGRSWSEDPPSRTRRLITNVRVTHDDGTVLSVESNFQLYRTRLNSQEDTWIGCRKDSLRRSGDSFLITARIILLEQTVILSRNLSNFF